MKAHDILLAVVVALFCSACATAELSSQERATLRDYQAAPKEAAQICLHHKLTKGQILDCMGDKYRIEMFQERMVFYYAPSMVLTMYFDKRGVLEKVSHPSFELSRDK